MAIKKLTYDLAVDALDRHMQKKTTHGTSDILQAMQSLSSMEFINIVDHNDFADISANFRRYVETNGLTSIGRKQFEAWWETCDMMPLEEQAPVTIEEPTAIASQVDQEDTLPEAFGTDESCRKAHVWDTNECIHCKVQDMERIIQELSMKIMGIRELAKWD